MSNKPNPVKEYKSILLILKTFKRIWRVNKSFFQFHPISIRNKNPQYIESKKAYIENTKHYKNVLIRIYNENSELINKAKIFIPSFIFNSCKADN